MKATKQYFPLCIILHRDRLISKEWTEWSFKFMLIEPLYEIEVATIATISIKFDNGSVQ